jgi:dephospho-CoA kinase
MILALAGTNGAGKGSVAEYLAERGYRHLSASGFITEEIVRRSLPVNRDSMRLVANDLRLTRNPAYLMERLYEQAVQGGGHAVIEAPRAIAEAAYLKSKAVYLIAVDAPRRLRYERIAQRGSVKDNVTFEQFAAQEDLELAQTAAHDMNILGVIRMADATIVNDGSIAELRQQVAKILSLI